jgi:CheY-like chemotaxis protein
VENFRADDYSVLAAGTAGEAIELLARSQPDPMLLDVVLPGMSGSTCAPACAVVTASTSRGIPTCRSSCFPEGHIWGT